MTTSASATSAAISSGDAVGAVVHDDAQIGCEARGLGGPVADDGGRRDHERGAGARAREEVGEHRRRLAEAHVEREATTEPDRVEEAEPRQRLGLVAAELADEAVGHAHRFGREVGRGVEQVDGPAGTADGDAARQRRAFEAEREPEHLAARELGLLRPLRERGGGFVEVGPVDRDPPSTGTDERPGLLGQPRDVGGGELDVVEHGRPPHVGELVRADRRRRRGVGEHPQRRLGPPPRQRGHPHVEPGGEQLRAGRRSSAPRPRPGSGSPDPDGVPPGRINAGSSRSRRAISSSRSRRSGPASTIACSIGTSSTVPSRRRAPRGATRRRRREDRAARSGRACSPVTERPQRSTRAEISPPRRSGASNALPSSRARNASATSVAVRMRGGGAGNLEPPALSRQIASTMPVSAERVSARASTFGSRARQRAASRRRRLRGGRGRRAPGSSAPSTTRSTRCSSAPPLALAQQRHHRAARRELDGPDRDPAQPTDAGSDVVARLARARGDEPAEHLADRDRERVGVGRACAADPGHRHRPVPGPARRGRARGGEHLRDGLRVRDRRAGACGPRHDPPGSHDTCSRTLPGIRELAVAMVATTVSIAVRSSLS